MTAAGLARGIVPTGASAAFLAELSVDDLPVSTEMRRRLRLLGLRTLGDLARLPQGPVAAQFGPEGAHTWELAHGIDRSPLVPYRPPRSITERLEFPSPVETSDVLVAATKRLLERALRRPEIHGRAVRGISLHILNEGLTQTAKQATFREPVSSPQRMLVVLKAKIESAVAAGQLGAFDEVELVLMDLCGESTLQERLFGTERSRAEHEEERVADAARQLKARYGRAMLAKVMEVEPWSRIPERRFALIDYDP